MCSLERVCKILLLIGLSVLIPVTNVRAETIEDVLNVYNLTLGKTSKSEIEQEISSIENEIIQNEYQQDVVRAYNENLRRQLKEHEKLLSDIEGSIEILTSRNDSISKGFDDILLDGSIEEILKLDGEFKRNENKITDLIDSLNRSYMFNEEKSYKDNRDVLYASLLEAQALYTESLDFYEIGDVTNIKFVLPGERDILGKYGYRFVDGKGLRFQNNVVYNARKGTNVNALFNGVVLSTGYSKVIGNFIVVESGNNIKYVCSALDEIYVQKGSNVNQGDLLGTTGALNENDCLCLSLYINGCSYDVDRLFSESEE